MLGLNSTNGSGEGGRQAVAQAAALLEGRTVQILYGVTYFGNLVTVYHNKLTLSA